MFSFVFVGDVNVADDLVVLLFTPVLLLSSAAVVAVAASVAASVAVVVVVVAVAAVVVVVVAVAVAAVVVVAVAVAAVVVAVAVAVAFAAATCCRRLCLLYDFLPCFLTLTHENIYDNCGSNYFHNQTCQQQHQH